MTQHQPDLTGGCGGGQRGRGSRRGGCLCTLEVQPETPGAWPWESMISSPWGHRRTGQALPLASHSRECQACHQPTPVISITLPVTQRELGFSLSNLLPPPSSLLSAAPALALISGFEGTEFNMMADSLGDRQFPPKPPASAWSGTFWSHRRADQEALTPALPACLSRARTHDSGNCSLQGGTKGSLVQGFGHSIYFLILTQAIQETLNLNKRSVPWPAPLSNIIATSALRSILPGANCAFCTLSPATRGSAPIFSRDLCLSEYLHRKPEPPQAGARSSEAETGLGRSHFNIPVLPSLRVAGGWGHLSSMGWGP